MEGSARRQHCGGGLKRGRGEARGGDGEEGLLLRPLVEGLPVTYQYACQAAIDKTCSNRKMVVHALVCDGLDTLSTGFVFFTSGLLKSVVHNFPVIECDLCGTCTCVCLCPRVSVSVSVHNPLACVTLLNFDEVRESAGSRFRIWRLSMLSCSAARSKQPDLRPLISLFFKCWGKWSQIIQ